MPGQDEIDGSVRSSDWEEKLTLTEREDRSDDVSHEDDTCQSTGGVVSVSVDDIGQDGVDDAEEPVRGEETYETRRGTEIAIGSAYPNPTQAKPIW
jgi:hypothetical protein